jgi:hypothetical protein
VWGEKKGLTSLEKPKNGRKRQEGEPCDQALADAQVLLSNDKKYCNLVRTRLQYLYVSEPTGAWLSATPPMGQSERYERFFYPVCFHSDMYLLNLCLYSRIFFPPHMRKSLEVPYRMTKRSKELLAALLAMSSSKFSSLTRLILPEERYSGRHRRAGSEG